MKKNNLFLFFFVVTLFMYSGAETPSKIKKNNFAKKKKLGLASPIVNFNNKEFFFRKEILLDNNNNTNLFPKGYSELTNMLLKSVKNKEIDAFTNEELKKRTTEDELKKILTIPINIENYYSSQDEKFFSGEEIKKIEIYGKYKKIIDLPQPTVENIAVTLIIPAGIADMTIERNVFSLRYNDFINLLKKKKLYIEKEGVKRLCSEAFEKIEDNFVYSFISINDIFLKKTPTTENNKIAEKFFKI